MLQIHPGKLPQTQSERYLLADNILDMSIHLEAIYTLLNLLDSHFEHPEDYILQDADAKHDYLVSYGEMQAEIYAIRHMLGECVDYTNVLAGTTHPITNVYDKATECRTILKNAHKEN